MQRILIILPNNLGDVIMALPVLDGIKRNNPLSYIAFFVEDGFEAGLEHYNNCDLIYKFPRKIIRDSEWKNGFDHLKKIVQELKDLQFDSIINLSQHPYLSYIVSLLGVADIKGAMMLRAGNMALNDMWSQYLYTIPFGRVFNRIHATDVYKKIAGLHGVALADIIVTQSERNVARAYLDSKKIAPEMPFVIFQPGAAFAAKRWPVENFVALGKMLINDGFHIVITGAPSEIDIGKGISDQLQSGCTITSGELTFRETIGITSFCEFCVTGDTALMHAASALHKKVYALFGSTNPVETGPYGDGHLIFAGRCVNRPCFCSECKSKLCMKSIMPQTVYGAINDKISSQSNNGCDIYQTSISKDGLYSLQSQYGTSASYYNEAGSLLTWRAFDSAIPLPEDSDDLQVFKSESMQFITIVKKMENELSDFIIGKNGNSISKFEELKNQLTQVKGIGEFWTALLNIRLNSIPILDIEQGIFLSREVCHNTSVQIASVFVA